MIIWLASYPRSGNSFARIALEHFFRLQVRTVYADRWCVLLGETPLDKSLEEAARSTESCFVKTHEMPAGDAHPAIYVVRDGRDALVSYAHFVLHTEYGIPAGNDREAFLRVLRELILSDDHFGGWSRNVLAWKQRAGTAVVRYEDLLANPADLLGNALISIGQAPLLKEDRPLPPFQDLHQAFPWFFRKGRAGTWRTEMPEALHDLFWERHGEAMAALGYQRDGPGMALTTTATDARNPDSAATPQNSGPGLANFSSSPYQAHNRARLAHLASLRLPLANRRVLELGSGPGDHTGFYVERQCAVVSVDARQDCLDALQQRYPGVQAVLCDLNEPAPLAVLGSFDVIHCYGILYHLEDPGRLVAYMGQSCSGLAIIETCVLSDTASRVDLVDETIEDYTQSSTGRACRPTRRWVFEELGRVFPFVYQTRTQPNHPEFPVNWNVLTSAPPLIRSVFVASKRPLDLPSLSPELLDVQERLDTTAYIATLESELAGDREILREREQLVMRLHAEAEAQRHRAGEFEAVAAERLREMEGKQAALQSLHAEAEAQRRRAGEFEAVAAERLREMESKQAALQSLHAEAEAQRRRAGESEAAAAERLREMESKEATLQSLHAEAERRGELLAAATAEAEAQRRSAGEFEAAAAEHLREAEAKEAVLAGLKREADWRGQELDRATRSLEELETRIGKLEESRRTLETEREGLQAEQVRLSRENAVLAGEVERLERETPREYIVRKWTARKRNS